VSRASKPTELPIAVPGPIPREGEGKVRGLADWLDRIVLLAAGYRIQRDRMAGHVRQAYREAERARQRLIGSDVGASVTASLLPDAESLAAAVDRDVDQVLPVVRGIHTALSGLPGNPLHWETELAKVLRDLQREVKVDRSLLDLDARYADPDRFQEDTDEFKRSVSERLRVLVAKIDDLRSVAIRKGEGAATAPGDQSPDEWWPGIARKAWLSAPDMAEKTGLPYNALRKRLKRWRKNRNDGWRDAPAGNRVNEASCLYLFGAVRPVCIALAMGKPTAQVSM